MAAYVVVEVDSTDAERAARYRELSGASVARHGGRFLARGGELAILEGAWRPARLVVIEFDSVAAARSWYESDDLRTRVACAPARARGTWWS
jgi:uncharacterized protein (DUF1330 family)